MNVSSIVHTHILEMSRRARFDSSAKEPHAKPNATALSISTLVSIGQPVTVGGRKEKTKADEQMKDLILDWVSDVDQDEPTQFDMDQDSNYEPSWLQEAEDRLQDVQDETNQLQDEPNKLNVDQCIDEAIAKLQELGAKGNLDDRERQALAVLDAKIREARTQFDNIPTSLYRTTDTQSSVKTVQPILEGLQPLVNNALRPLVSPTSTNRGPLSLSGSMLQNWLSKLTQTLNIKSSNPKIYRIKLFVSLLHIVMTIAFILASGSRISSAPSEPSPDEEEAVVDVSIPTELLDETLLSNWKMIMMMLPVFLHSGNTLGNTF